MPSPFPGMDPYIEQHAWPDFHTSLAVVLRNRIAQKLPPSLIVDIEVSTVTPALHFTASKTYRPDVTVSTTDDNSGSMLNDGGGITSPTPPTIEVPRLVEQEFRQRTLHIKSSSGGELVAVVEILSPANKREPHLSQYRTKRSDFFSSGIHVLEIDLLREGTRPFHQSDVPECTYCIQLDHVHRQTCLIWSLDLADPLPHVSLPLSEGMDAIDIDLQDALKENYRDGLYELKLNYDRPLQPGLRRAIDREFLALIK